MKDLEKRIVELEERYSYQENLVSELNIIVAKQEREIEELISYVRQVIKSKDDSREMTMDSLADDKPPHY